MGERVSEVIMERHRKEYLVWYYSRADFLYRIGQTFKTKKEHDEFVNTLKPWQYHGTVVKYYIWDDDINNAV